MNNIYKAARIIADANAARRSRRGTPDIVTIQAATEYAQALHDAGMLLPDMSLADDDFWKHDAYIIGNLSERITIEAEPGKVFFYGPGASGLTPQNAREAAQALLAAAQYAKEKA